ncbi:hypothetical protein GIB67_036894 [Kingdonia uniflora]|uniref:Uncharacterized protein n=1 Tax=Kingdonia uniflora TaxID=39325 RepID=A0A7J7L0V7_9MAGN|nr:hypothetical protein GIB67_001626 [Kingdonia uniflora]KAF6145383.1 hypothetical protein GIB67_036894 [Kingdonia uniflora]
MIVEEVNDIPKIIACNYEKSNNPVKFRASEEENRAGKACMLLFQLCFRYLLKDSL